MSIVWNTAMSMSEKVVMLKLADNANDDGDAIYPKKSTIKAQTGAGETVIGEVIRKYVEIGVLAVVEPGGGRGKPTRYAINVEALKAQPRIEIPLARRRVSETTNPSPGGMFDDINPSPGDDKPLAERCVSESALNTGSLTIIEPSERDALRSRIERMLKTVPGFARATGGWEPRLGDFLDSQPGMRGSDWIDFVNYVLDAVSELPSMKVNSCSAFSPIASMRERIIKWQRSTGWSPNTERSAVIEHLSIPEDNRERVFVDLADADCMAWSRMAERFMPARRDLALARKMRICEIGEESTTPTDEVADGE